MQTIYLVMFAVAVVIAVAINGALIAAIVRFRARRGEEPARRTAGRGVVGRVAVGLGALSLVVFIVGIVFTESIRDAEPSGPNGIEVASSRTAQVNISPPPADTDPLRINAIGQQWLWRYEYPQKESDDQTFQPIFSYEKLVVPVDTTVILNVTSTDVVHRWSVPSLAGKVDAVPGQVATTWFKAEEPGIYEGQSFQYSGPGYSTMRTEVEAVPVTEYAAFVADQREAISAAQQAVTDQDEADAATEEEVATQ